MLFLANLRCRRAQYNVLTAPPPDRRCMIAGGMLKIGTVKWRGRCPRHPMFDPEADGPGAIRGGCSRCQELQTIFESHQRTLRLMRIFAPQLQTQRRKADPVADR